MKKQKLLSEESYDHKQVTDLNKETKTNKEVKRITFKQ